MEKEIIIEHLCHIRPAQLLRKTPAVLFTHIPVIDGLGAIDHVIHEKGANSPAIKGYEGDRPWYMHPGQEDNLHVISGLRVVELYSYKHGRIETFEVTPEYVKHNGKMLYEGETLFGWPTDTFHRITSPYGSNSINYAVHTEKFDIKTNFNIYALDAENANHTLLREGHKDQPDSKA